MRAALSFLTRLPVGPAASDDYLRDLGRSAGLFPLVGLPVGGVSLLVYLGSRLLFGPAVAAVLTIAAGLWASGGLHLDGLMDTADGVLSSRSRERMLEIMKDPRAGAMGVAAGALSILLRFALLLQLETGSAACALLVAPSLGRMVMPLAAAGWSPARGEGGIGSAFARHLGWGQVALSLMLGLITALGVPMIGIAAGEFDLHMLVRGGAAWAAAVSASLGGGRWLAHRLGGLTGDTYGALCELAELAALACFAAGVRGWAAL